MEPLTYWNAVRFAMFFFLALMIAVEFVNDYSAIRGSFAKRLVLNCLALLFYSLLLGYVVNAAVSPAIFP